jgi:hypothetical protein
MRQPDTVIAGVWRALKPGGRFVAELGGDGCVARIRAALMSALARRGIDGESLNPWYFPTGEDYCTRLRAGGFVVRSAVLVPRPTALPGDLDGWLSTFAQSFIAALAPEERAAFVAEVKRALAPDLCDAEGRWWADYVRLRFSAEKPV